MSISSSIFSKGDKTSYEGSKIDAITSQFGIQQEQLFNEPTHLVADSSPCIDLIFTSQPDLVMESGVRSSLHPNCHQQLTYAKSIPIQTGNMALGKSQRSSHQ